MKFKEYVGVKLSDHIIKDDNGQLICTYAIISREGEQKYWRHDLPKYDPSMGDYEVILKRPWESVSEEESIRSFENKPVVIRHPRKGNIYVDDYKEETVVGFVRDVMVGPEKVNGYRVIVATIVITDPDAIEAILSGELRELSCGYECDIDMDNWTVYNIRGNHVAIVPSGRAEIAQIMDAADEILQKLHKIMTPEGEIYSFNTANELDNILTVKNINEIDELRYEGSIVNDINDLPKSYREILKAHGFVGEDNKGENFEVEEINDESDDSFDFINEVFEILKEKYTDESLSKNEDEIRKLIGRDLKSKDNDVNKRILDELKTNENSQESVFNYIKERFKLNDKQKEEVKMEEQNAILLDENEAKQGFIIKIKSLSWDSNLIYKLILRFGLSRDVVITKPRKNENLEDPNVITTFKISSTKTPTHMTVLHEYYKLFGSEILAKYDFDAFGNATKQEPIQWSLFQLFFTVKYEMTIENQDEQIAKSQPESQTEQDMSEQESSKSIENEGDKE